MNKNNNISIANQKKEVFIMQYEEVVKNAIEAAKRDGYSQVVYKDEDGYSFSRDYPENQMYRPENVLGRVEFRWKNGFFTVEYVKEPQRTTMLAEELDAMVNAMRSKYHSIESRTDLSDELFYLSKGLRAIGLSSLAGEIDKLYNQIEMVDTNEIVKLGTFNRSREELERD